MFEALKAFLNSDDFIPHGHCMLWQPGIVWLHVFSDAAIALAYFGIPLALFYFVKKRKDLPFKEAFLLVSAFVMLCGLTHLISIWVLWHPDYAIEGIVKALTAVVSVATLVMIIILMPKALALISPEARLLAAIVESSEDAVISKGLDGIISSWNKGAERMFGYKAAEAIGQNISLIIPDYKSEEENQIIEQLRAGKYVQQADTVRQHKDGRLVHTSLSISPVRDSTGRVVGASTIARDISERKEIEDTREQLRHAQRMEALGQLTGGIAHDFNNLLAIIIGNLDFMYERMDEHDALRKYVTPSIEAALYGSELTRRLLAFGRKQSLQPKILSLNALLVHFQTLVGRILGERIEVVITTAPDLWSVSVDPNQFENALLNLSVNARDAMPGGGRIVYETKNTLLGAEYAVQHAEVMPGEYVMIAVSDTGTGMTPEVMEKAFDPFFTTKRTGEGTGLGLSMVYGFVKQSNGHIKLYSEPGYGTSVKIYLPRVYDSDSVFSGFEEESPKIDERHQHKTIRILVVEDNQEVLNVTAAMVKSLGYEVIESTSGEQALEVLKARNDIDLLLTDVMLPGTINGPELARLAVQMQPALKVLFNSGYAEHAIFQNGILDKGTHLIAKPFRKAQLAEKIAEVLT